MDFGIAKLAQQETGLTQTGMTLGTAAYLAPEQIRGDAVATATDVFSFGVLAYELLTYQRPFPGEQISAVLYALLHTDPQPVHEHWPAAPQDIVELIDCCLSKQAPGRYASGAELQRALETIQKQGAIERSGAVPSPSPLMSNPPAASPRPMPRPPSVDSTPTPTPTRLDELEIEVMGSGTVSAPAPQPPNTSGSDLMPISARPGSGTDVGIEVEATELLYTPEPPKEPSRAPWLIVAALALLAGIGGWWLGSRADNTPHEPPPVQDVDSGAEDGEAGSDGAASDPASGDGATDASGSSGSGSGNGSGNGPGDGASTAKAAVRARVVVRAPTWTESMTLQVNSGIVRALVKNQEIPLDAGRHVLDFAVDTGGYSSQSRQIVQLAEGERLVVSPEIREPATLSVRPLPRTPQGLLRIDGGAAVSTPVNGLLLAPGSRQIEIAARTPSEDGTTASLVQTLDLASGQRVAITFDLDSGELTVR